MPIEIGFWRTDGKLEKMDVSSLDQEKRLEGFLSDDISIASPNWIVVGRQVYTAFGSYIDLLALDRDGNLIIVELKKDMTPREVVAQLLDYASWAKELDDGDIAEIYQEFVTKYQPERADKSIDDAFIDKFKVKEMPDSLNKEHQLVVVASSLDASTERIVTYLSEEHGVPINAIFFRVFKDGEREYLSSAWFIDPTEKAFGVSEAERKDDWNGEFYVSFGHGDRRDWDDARKYGFISAGGGPWYSKTLYQLQPGDHVWANVPGVGYVGVGTVKRKAVRVDQFKVIQDDGSEKYIKDLPLTPPEMLDSMSDDNLAEHLVAIDWEKTVDLDQAVREKGFFGNQNSVCRPSAKSWNHTIDRLKKRFSID